MTRTPPNPNTSAIMKSILGKLQTIGPMTPSEIALSCNISLPTLQGGRYLTFLHKKYALIHVSGWRRNFRGPASPIYSLGAGSDAPNTCSRQTIEASNSAGLQAIVATLECLGPMTAKEVATLCNLSYKTIKGGGYMKALKAQDKIHISGWKRQPSKTVPVYTAGAGKDAPRPPAYSNAERLVRFRDRKRLFNSSQVSLFVRQMTNKPLVRMTAS